MGLRMHRREDGNLSDLRFSSECTPYVYSDPVALGFENSLLGWSSFDNHIVVRLWLALVVLVLGSRELILIQSLF